MLWCFDCFRRIFAKSTNILTADQENTDIRDGLPESVDLIRWWPAIWIDRPIEKFIYLMAFDGLTKVYFAKQRRWLKRVSYLS